MRGFRAGLIAAGEGSRLKASHPSLIKPLVPVAGSPLCHWVVRALSQAGVREFVALFNTRGGAARESLRQTFPTLCWSFLEKDTASSWESFRLVAQTLSAEDDGAGFLISTIDALIPHSEVRRFAEEARASRAAAALALTRFVDDEKPLWADVDSGGRVTALGLRGKDAQVTCGLYYLTAEAARVMPGADSHGSLRGYLTALVRQSRVAAITLSKTLDVDRPEDLVAAESFLSQENR